ncbi:MAG: hypothetical protein DSY87_08170 [Methylococcus sp.]|nr:MAG: hypothetical protein DSY87_08170 [Methylococcus sp.]
MNISNSSATGILMIDQTRAENAAFALLCGAFPDPSQRCMTEKNENQPCSVLMFSSVHRLARGLPPSV